MSRGHTIQLKMTRRLLTAVLNLIEDELDTEPKDDRYRADLNAALGKLERGRINIEARASGDSSRRNRHGIRVTKQQGESLLKLIDDELDTGEEDAEDRAALTGTALNLRKKLTKEG